jgi:CubicO group peptidase (beta-lactamase class C family)
MKGVIAAALAVVVATGSGAVAAAAGPASAATVASAIAAHNPRVKVARDSADPWRQVPRSRVAAKCGLSPKELDAAYPELSITPFAVIRYGRLCWSGGSKKGLHQTYEVASEAKTFSALLFGVIAARTDVDENDRVYDWATPGEMNTDLVGTLLSQPPINPNARIFHLLTQTGQDPLGYGLRPPWFYDAVGVFGMNALVTIMNNVVKANPKAFPGCKTANDVAKKYLFKPLGMRHTYWEGVVASHSLYSTVLDMAKLGQLMLRKGRWGKQQIVDPDYIYRMSHPQVEDVHTGYGYLTWLNTFHGAALLFQMKTDQVCAPYTGWRRYPHPPMYDAPNAHGGDPFTRGYDDGVFWADGAGGNFTEIHRGLDLVLVIRDDEAAQSKDPEAQKRGSMNATGFEYHRMWRIVRPALIAEDPTYRGREAAFCNAYRTGSYAPDLISRWNARSGWGSVHLR